jgi:predicted DNA-binding protein (MmcQ/YjbR family)
MTLSEFNWICGSLAHTSIVVQWGGAHVWKVAGKVFVIGRDTDGEIETVSFKCSPLMFEVLKNEPGVQPAPYLASRGLSWLQRTSSQSLSDVALKDAMRESHRLVSLGLSKALQKQLGLNQTPTAKPRVSGKPRSQATPAPQPARGRL